MTGPAFLGDCLVCGEHGEVINALDYEERPTGTVQVPIRLDSSQRPAVETREYPARYIPVRRCKDRAACDGRVAAYQALELERAAAARRATLDAQVPAPGAIEMPVTEPEVIGVSTEPPIEGSWFR